MGFTIATYNVLADAYLRAEWYPLTPRGVLDPTVRRKALLAHLPALEADVLCLQEVEEATFAAIEARLTLIGYAGLLAMNGGGRPDGCAMFYRERLFALVEAVRAEYADENGWNGPSGHVAQLVVLEQGDRHLGLANTHVKWDPPDMLRSEQYGYRQVEQLLRLHGRYLSRSTASVICGDFNATPGSDTIAMMRKSGLKFAHEKDPAAYTSNVGGEAKTIDYLFYDEALRAEPHPLPTVSARTPLPGPDQPSDHVVVAASFEWVS